MGETHARKLHGALLGIHALTSLHAGSGAALGTIDLPIQRERHTGWPMIAGSALKGVLRDACREKVKANHSDEYEEKDGKRVMKDGMPVLRRSRRRVANEDDESLVAVFGPAKVEQDSAAAGALSVTDARILAFPVRSLKGVFAWVTCPGVLDRFKRDASLAGLSPTVPDLAVPADRYVAARDCPCRVDGKIVLEEFDFSPAEGGTDAIFGGLPEALGALLPDSDVFKKTRERLARHIVVLSDEDFTHFVRHATEVSARIALNYETKAVRGGALFYQEFLPPETLLYALVLADEARATARSNGRGSPAAASAAPMSAADVLAFLEKLRPDFLQIGGDETTGKGLCATRLALP